MSSQQKVTSLDGLESRLAEIEGSTRKLVESETLKFEAYISILRDQMVGVGEQLEHENEVLREEVARVTEQLSIREMDMESRDRKIFELEKSSKEILEANKGFERELRELEEEKEALRGELTETSDQLEKLRREREASGKEMAQEAGAKKAPRCKSKKRASEEEQSCEIENKINEEGPVLKKGRLRRIQSEDQSDSKKSIGREAEPTLEGKKQTGESNPLKEVLGKTNLGRLRAPLLRSRVVKAAQAASPDVEGIPELKTLEKENSGSGRLNKSDSGGSKKPSKKTSKVAKIAKIPHYDENILNSMKVAELKDICNKLRLEVNQRSRKSDLIQSILSFQGE
ncbi:Rho termination factor N-terminal domain protein [Cryptosporidium felis]|nr:Rho termination factor N-terminal domain protein [Cryptosporidium felis]